MVVGSDLIRNVVSSTDQEEKNKQDESATNNKRMGMNPTRIKAGVRRRASSSSSSSSRTQYFYHTAHAGALYLPAAAHAIMEGVMKDASLPAGEDDDNQEKDTKKRKLEIQLPQMGDIVPPSKRHGEKITMTELKQEHFYRPVAPQPGDATAATSVVAIRTMALNRVIQIPPLESSTTDPDNKQTTTDADTQRIRGGAGDQDEQQQQSMGPPSAPTEANATASAILPVPTMQPSEQPAQVLPAATTATTMPQLQQQDMPPPASRVTSQQQQPQEPVPAPMPIPTAATTPDPVMPTTTTVQQQQSQFPTQHAPSPTTTVHPSTVAAATTTTTAPTTPLQPPTPKALPPVATPGVNNTPGTAGQHQTSSHPPASVAPRTAISMPTQPAASTPATTFKTMTAGSASAAAATPTTTSATHPVAATAAVAVTTNVSSSTPASAAPPVVASSSSSSSSSSSAVAPVVVGKKQLRPPPKVTPLQNRPPPHWNVHIPGPNDEMPREQEQQNPVTSWFNPKTVSSVERALLPEWFNQSSVHRTPQTYIKVRQHILNMAKKLGNRSITPTLVRRSVNGGDAGSLFRLLQFLQIHGLINHDSINNDSTPTLDVSIRPKNTNNPPLSVTWTRPWQSKLLHAVAAHKRVKTNKDENNDEKKEDDSTPVIDWQGVATTMGRTVADCQRGFLTFSATQVAESSQQQQPETIASQPSNKGDDAISSFQGRTWENLLLQSKPKWNHDIIEAALKAANDDADKETSTQGKIDDSDKATTSSAQQAATRAVLATQAMVQARGHEERLSQVLAQINETRLLALENKVGMLQDVEAMLEAERMALELERRDLYTARCRHWFGGDYVGGQ